MTKLVAPGSRLRSYVGHREAVARSRRRVVVGTVLVLAGAIAGWVLGGLILG